MILLSCPRRFFRAGLPALLLAVAAALPLVPATLTAQSGLTVPKGEDEIFREAQLVMPPYPRAASLLRFPTDLSSHAILFDEAGLIVGDDGVIRYVLVVRSLGGAENVSYEGIRCATGERRVFAFGRKSADGGTWAPARNSEWAAITDSRINRYYFEIWRDVFCDGKRVEQRKALLENLKRGGRERASGLPSD